ncbi:MAG: amino acid adenylation domain-containing protein [Paracoccaceae bacterium]
MSGISEYISRLRLRSAFALLTRARRIFSPGNGPVPLSLSQQAILAAERLEPGLASYVLMRAWDFAGKFDEPAFERALDLLSARHDALRMSLSAHKGDHFACFARQIERPLHYRLLDTANCEDIEKEIDGRISNIALTPIRPLDEPLWQMWVLEVSSERRVVCLKLHHVIGDDWSRAIIGRDLFAFYGEEAGIVPARLPEADQFRACLAGIAGGRLQTSQRPKTEASGLDLILAASSKTDARGAREEVRRTVREIRDARASALVAKTRASCVTPFAFFAAAVDLAIARFCDQEDAVLSLSVSRRESEAQMNTVGCLSDVMNYSGRLDDNRTFAAHARSIGKAVVEFRRQPAKETARNTVTFSFYDAPDSLGEPGPFRVTRRDISPSALFSHLHVGVRKKNGGFRLILDARRGSFGSDLLERIADCLMLILDQAIENPEVRLGDIRLMPPEEEVRIAVLSVNSAERRETGDIASRFLEIATRFPDKPALIGPERTWSYRALEQASIRLAHWLRQSHLTEGAIVGIALPRGEALVMTTLAAIRAGLVLVPMDLEYPMQRLVRMGRIAGVSAILCQTSDLPGLEASARLINVPNPEDLDDCPDPPWHLTNDDPDRTAYIMFTSGTTGTPKGIPTSHRAVLRMTVGSARSPVGPGDRFVQLTSPGFDVVFDEIWGAWLNGAELVVTTESLTASGKFAERFRALRPTAASLTARLLDLVVDTDPAALGSLRVLSTGGELVSPSHIRKAMQANPELRIFNCYGPAENTGVTTIFPIAEGHKGPLPIGRPLKNFAAFVLTDALLPVPVGFAGELCVGGPGLSRGYLDRADETERKFVSVPASSLGLTQGGDIRLYRTGDRARWNEDLQLEFLGRKDTQFKVNGHRIESAEIELALLDNPGVTGAVVEPDFKASETTPCGILAFVSRTANTPDEATLRSNLAKRLPRQMLPTRYLFPAAIPRNQNGKADRVRLRELADEASRRAEDLQPRNDPLTSIWQDILGCAVASEDADFFQLGGSSLSVVRMVAKVESTFDCNLDLTAVLTDARLKNLRILIERATESELTETRHMVRLKPGKKNATPVVFLHGLYGSLGWSNTPIVEWTAPNAVYGLTFIRRDDESWRPDDVEHLLADFVSDLRTVFGDTDFHLAGFSSGGLTALALHKAAREAGLNPDKLFILDGKLRLMDFEAKSVSVASTVKDWVAFLTSRPRKDIVSCDIHYFASTRDFEFPYVRLIDDWALVTKKRLLVYRIESSHSEIVTGPRGRIVADLFNRILTSEIPADRVYEGLGQKGGIGPRLAAAQAAHDGDIEGAIGMLEPLVANSNAIPDWLAISLLRLYRLSARDHKGEIRLRTRLGKPTNYLILNEMIASCRKRAMRMKMLAELIDMTGDQMLGSLRLTEVFCRMGKTGDARRLSERMLANPKISPAGLFSRAVIADIGGDEETLEKSMIAAMSDDGIEPPQAIWAVKYLRRAGRFELAERVVAMKHARFLGQY